MDVSHGQDLRHSLYTTLDGAFPKSIMPIGVEHNLKQKIRKKLRKVGWDTLFRPGEEWERTVGGFAIRALDTVYTTLRAETLVLGGGVASGPRRRRRRLLAARGHAVGAACRGARCHQGPSECAVRCPRNRRYRSAGFAARTRGGGSCGGSFGPRQVGPPPRRKLHGGGILCSFWRDQLRRPRTCHAQAAGVGESIVPHHGPAIRRGRL